VEVSKPLLGMIIGGIHLQDGLEVLKGFLVFIQGKVTVPSCNKDL
jgi:hypothetical protein